MARSKLSSALNFINPKTLIYFFRELVTEYGIKFTLMMMSMYIGIEGSLKTFLDLNETAYYKEAGYPVSVNQTVTAISRVPMAIKGLVGLASDLFPILGYEKGTYFALSTFLGSFCLILLILVPVSADTHPYYLPAIFFFMVNVQVFYSDILMQGKYTELMKDNPTSRGNIITFNFFCINLGAFIPASMVGIMAETLPSPRITFVIALPFALQPLIFLTAGCMVHDKVHPMRNNRFDYVKFKLQLPIVLLNLFITFGALGSAFFGLFTSTNATFIYSVISAVLAIAACFIGLPLVVANISFYLFLGQTMYLQVQPTLEYFLLGDEVCVPGGPHFDYTYLKSYIGLVTQFGRLLAVWIYQSVMTKWKYRQIFWVSSLIRIFAAFFDIAIVLRWNIALGIPDHFFYLFGHAIVFEITYMLDYMPFSLMIAKLCPKNIEVTLFSLLSGFVNYGSAIGVFAGGFVAQMFGIATHLEGGKCNFDNMHWVIVVANCISPALLIPLAFVFIPNKKVGQNIADTTFENSRYLFKVVKYYKVDYDENGTKA